MEFKAGKYYKMRSGNKAKIYEIVESNLGHTILGAYFLVDDWIPIGWYSDGKYLRNENYHIDIVSDWVGDDVVSE
ncbi:MAG TPA: hypothetical protein PLQ34_09980 [Ferrovaceae bacterium]|nr:hypothetical protein [Ferrovaceae bacterium]